MHDDNVVPEDLAATETDSRVRELLLSLPRSATQFDFESRVSAKICRRKNVRRVVIGVGSLMILLSGFLYNSYRKVPRQPEFVVQDNTTELSADPRGEFELFAVAYHGLSSPVIELDTLDRESQAWFTFVSSLDETTERQ
ncbi:MAG: hypothetical protein VB878_20955 [Pirellulaceae bacterium]